MNREVLGLDELSKVTVWARPWIDWSAPPRRYEASAAQLPRSARAVYIAVDWRGQVSYVGSVARSGGGGVAQRFTEHLRARHEARYWTHLWVVQFHDGTPANTVRWLEGVIGRALAPPDNKRLPTAC